MKDIILRVLSRFGLDRLAGEYAEEFLRNAAFVNLSRARMFSVILVILQFPLIYIDIQNRQRGLWTSIPGYFYLFIMHVAVGVAFSLFYILASIEKPRSPSDITSWHKAVGSMFPLLGMLAAIAVSIVGQMIHDQITVYVIAAFWVAVGLYLGNPGALALYTGSYLLFALGIHQVQHDPRLLMANMINAGVLTVLAFLLSRVLYRAEARDFASTKILEKRKEILQIEKFLLEEAASKAVASLRESEARFRTLAETSSAAIFIHQGNSLIYLNAAARTIAGYTKEELQRMNFWNIIHPSHREMVEARARERLMGRPVPSEYEFMIIDKEERERWLHMTAGLIEYEGRPAIIGMLFDITDRKKAEEERTRLYEENIKQYKARLEEERRHQQEREEILKDLHDGIGGIMTNIGLLSELAQREVMHHPPAKTLSTISELSREALCELRTFMSGLDDKDTDWQDFIADMRRFGSNMIEPHSMNFDIRAEVEDGCGRPYSLICLNLFRIYKEALTNIVKHSKAGSVAVEMDIRRDMLTLSISDDGVGLHNWSVAGRGLANMMARSRDSRDIGGDLTITADKGTRLFLKIPLPQKYPDLEIDAGRI